MGGASAAGAAGAGKPGTAVIILTAEGTDSGATGAGRAVSNEEAKRRGPGIATAPTGRGRVATGTGAARRTRGAPAGGGAGAAGNSAVTDSLSDTIATETGAPAGVAKPAASIGPVPFNSQGIDRSGIAARIRWTTSRLGLLRPERMWLTMGRAMPMASANWVGVSCRTSSSVRMRSTIVICLITNVDVNQ